jgi:hypothetical protein
MKSNNTRNMPKHKWASALPPWSVGLNALKDWLVCNLLGGESRDMMVFNALKYGCFTTSSSAVLNALKDWLLRNLLSVVLNATS